MSHGRTRSFVSSTRRSWAPKVDLLEVRELLSTIPGPTVGPIASGFTAHPMFEVGSLVTNASPPSYSFTPAQIRQAYNFSSISFNGITGDGTGQTVAIVDAYDSPTVQADLNVFSTQFGLPATTITRVNQNGGTTYPATDSTGGWEMETALDVEWVHAVAPGASILLVEASSPSDNNLLAAVDYASSHASVVSMSWGGSEFSSEASYDGHFVHSGVAFVASSGDSGAPISWPASSPNVVAVGGTSLKLGSGNTYASEAGWSGSGGGPSAYFSQPTYQSGIVNLTTKRANPDVAYDASPSTGFAVYDSYPNNGTSYGWLNVGGTSAGAPQWAALVAIANQGRSLASLSALNGTDPKEVLKVLYQNAGTAAFHDVTTGTSTGSPHYSAGAGYDYVTGIGSPVANLVVQSLVGVVAANDHLVISAPATDNAGVAASVTVTAQGSGGTTDAAYRGTIHFSSSDVQAGLPANYTFTAADAGTHTFSVTPKTAGNQTVTATDTASASITATSSAIAVSPAAASQAILTGLSTTATAGASQTFTVTMRDAFGNLATGYTGTVSFSSSDTAATLPGSYTFTTADAGVHAFSLTFATPGNQSVTVSDALAGFSASQSGIVVSPAAPASLIATSISTSEIDLSWTGSAGATGYQVERSANGTSGWTQVGTTVAAVTTYQDTGLTAGTTYYYRVRANGGTIYTNTASAATAASSSGPGLSFWSNSFVPSEDAYGTGNYEVGLKFRTDVAGSVTGVRFYKQTWMDGYTHIGHLWAPSGALLATVTFTGESSYGWQQMSFSQPVSISPKTTYIISFSTGGGKFGITTTGLSTTGIDNGPIHAPATKAVSGGNGVYHTGIGLHPNTNANGMNFWVDVVFSPTSTSSIKPSAATGTLAGSSSVASPIAPSASPSLTVSVPTATARKSPAVTPASTWPNRGVVAQVLSFGSSRVGTSQTLGSYDF